MDAIALIDQEMRAVVEAERARLAGTPAPAGGDAATEPLHGMIRYHLGWVDQEFRPAAVGGGKKLRGQLCLLACELVGGPPERALPLAAAVELLHNFTLVHDDIQDQGPLRWHRPTVWSLWGVGQAINVGDGIASLGRLALLRLGERGVPGDLVLDLAARGERTLLRILEGQYLDLRFEADWSATVALYERMIEGKTASLIRYCLEAGALVGGGGSAAVAALGRCGRALGLGFQVRDDILGIWGEPAVTGKPAADDLRRRKKSLPVLVALERATAAERAALTAAYARPALDDADLARVLALLDRTAAQAACQARVEEYHREALAALEAVGAENAAGAALLRLIAQLVERRY